MRVSEPTSVTPGDAHGSRTGRRDAILDALGRREAQRMWADHEIAELYARFCEEHPLARETSRDLALLAELSDASMVVDMACGSGATTREILTRVRQDCRITALDRSEAMLKLAEQSVADNRVKWLHASAVDVASHVAEADAILCNSAIWQLDMPATVKASAKALRIGGRLVFNLAPALVRHFLTPPPEQLRPSKPTLSQIIQAIAVLEYDFALPHPAIYRGRLEMTPEGICDLLERNGFVVDHVKPLEYEQSAESQIAWLGVPIFTENVLPGLPRDVQLKVLEAAYLKWDKSPATEVWMAFAARKIDHPD